MSLDSALLQLLVCPVCRGSLEPMGDEGLACAACAKVYPIFEDIPVMLAEEAVPLAAWQSGKRQSARSRLSGLGQAARAADTAVPGNDEAR